MYPIPANATRIRYLEINGDGAYINTGVTPRNSPRAALRAQYLGTSQSSAQTTPLFGRRDYSNSYKYFAFWVRSDTLKMAVNWGTYDTGWQSSTTDTAAFHDYELNSSGGYFDGTNFVSVSSGGSIGAWTGTPVYVGAVCQLNAGEDLVTRGVKMRVASFQIWNDDGATIAFDGIPVRIGSTGYLFDRVSGQLFGNAGTGDFVLGPDTFQQGVVPTRMMAMGVRKKKVWPVPLYTGVSLVGSSVQNNSGILSGFTESSYATMPWRMTSGATSLEAVCKFHFTGETGTTQGIWGCVGSKNAFTPFYYISQALGTPYVFGPYISSNGTSWDVAMADSKPWSYRSPASGDYILRVTFSGSQYSLARWSSGWVTDSTFSGSAPYGESNLVPQLGTNRGQSSPFLGTIDLNYTYLMRDGELWWEGAPGAYKNVKTTYPD